MFTHWTYPVFTILSVISVRYYMQKQPSRGVPRKSVLKIYSKFTGEHPCRSAISIKLLSNFIKITFRHVCSPVNLLYIFRTPFPRNISGWLLLYLSEWGYIFENIMCSCRLQMLVSSIIYLTLSA